MTSWPTPDPVTRAVVNEYGCPVPMNVGGRLWLGGPLINPAGLPAPASQQKGSGVMYPSYDPDQICPKCGWPGVGSTYETAILPPSLWCYASLMPHPERIKRSCTRCMAVWYQRPVVYTQEDEDRYIAQVAESKQVGLA